MSIFGTLAILGTLLVVGYLFYVTIKHYFFSNPTYEYTPVDCSTETPCSDCIRSREGRAALAASSVASSTIYVPMFTEPLYPIGPYAERPRYRPAPTLVKAPGIYSDEPFIAPALAPYTPPALSDATLDDTKLWPTSGTIEPCQPYTGPSYSSYDTSCPSPTTTTETSTPGC